MTLLLLFLLLPVTQTKGDYDCQRQATPRNYGNLYDSSIHCQDRAWNGGLGITLRDSVDNVVIHSAKWLPAPTPETPITLEDLGEYLEWCETQSDTLWWANLDGQWYVGDIYPHEPSLPGFYEWLRKK